MSVDNAVADDESLNRINSSSNTSDKNNNNHTADVSCKESSGTSNQQQQPPTHSTATSSRRECVEETPAGDQQKLQQSLTQQQHHHHHHQHHHHQKQQHASHSTNNKNHRVSSSIVATNNNENRETPKEANSQQRDQQRRRRRRRSNRRSPPPPVKSPSTTPSACHQLVERIIYTVGELEHTLIEDQQNDFELRMALERQTERVHDLRSSLATERQRNERLVQLIRGVDSASSTDEDEAKHLAGGGASCINGRRWHSRTSLDAFASISPLLMQQRYDELVLSHKQCRKQLIQKEKQLTRTKCEREEARGQFDNLLDEYRVVQKRFEELCCKYLRLQAKKNQEILKLREALSYASDCVISAQQVMEGHGSEASCSEQFNQNLQLFITALRLCEWVQNSNRVRSSQREK